MSTKEILKPKEIVKEMKKFIITTWGRKELGVDTVCILVDAIILTSLPLLYDRLPKGVGRIITVLILIAFMLAITLFIILRLVQRNKKRKLEKMDYLHLLLRSVVVVAAVWIFACLMVGLIHPSLTGIYAILMTVTERLRVTIFNCLFFSFCSQSILTILTGTEEKNKAFFRRLVKTWAIAVLPMFLLTFLFTLLTERVRELDAFASGIRSVKECFLFCDLL